MRGRVLLGAHVTAVAAVWIERRVTAADEADALRHFRQQGRPDIAAAIERAMAEIRAAARGWRAAQDEEMGGPTTDVGNAETRSAETAALSDRVLLTPAAAQLLGVTGRRVRQLLADGSLAGDKVAGQWLVDRESVEEFQTRRSLTA